MTWIGGEDSAVAAVARRRRRGGSTFFLYYGGTDPTTTGATFTRADAATCATYCDSAGIWQTVAANIPRYQHYVSGVGPTLLLEPARTNGAKGACSFADATYWTNMATFTRTPATSCIAGQTAQTVTGTTNEIYQTAGTFVNGQQDCLSVILEKGTATQTYLHVYDATAAAYLARISLTWSNLAIATVAGSPTSSGVQILSTVGPNGRQLVRFWLVTTGTAAGTGAAGNTRQIEIKPSPNSAATDVTLHHAQFEANARNASSPIVTVAGAVTRAADALSWAIPFKPQALTLFCDAYWLNTAPAADNAIFNLGGSSDEALQFYRNTSNQPYWYHYTTVDVNSSTATQVTYGQRLEFCGSMTADGKVLATSSVNSAAVVSGSLSAASDVTTAWAANTLAYAANGAIALSALKVAGGPRDLGFMRGL